MGGLNLSTMEERREQFRDYVKACNERDLIIGQGNILADILFIGCEPNKTVVGQREHTDSCLNETNGNTIDVLWGTRDKKEIGGEGATWNKYQKVIDRIYHQERTHTREVLDFEEKAFCTDLNKDCKKHSKDADKSTLPQKLQLFKESSFIQSFPVVILACGPDYIVNHGDKLEINETFGVVFAEEVSVSKDSTTRAQRYWVHYDDKLNPHKLVIHTRQLSGGSRPYDELLWSIGRIIRMFLSSIGKLK